MPTGNKTCHQALTSLSKAIVTRCSLHVGVVAEPISEYLQSNARKSIKRGILELTL